VRVSISLTNYSWPGGPATTAALLTAIAQRADEAGVDTVWVPDHLVQADPASDVHEPMLEAYSVLSFLAGRTSEVRLGTLVTAATFRPPALLIKQVTTLDVLSGGRAWLGLGAGYNTDEGRAMGVPVPDTTARYESLIDTLVIARRLWAGDESPYSGLRTDLHGPIASPAPLTRPHPPILVGGTGPNRTLRIVAEHADAANFFDIPDGGATLRRQVAVLERHCAQVGRDPAAIERTVSTALAPGESAEQFGDRCRKLAAVGMDHVIVIVRGVPWTATAMATVATAVADLAHVTRGDE